MAVDQIEDFRKFPNSKTGTTPDGSKAERTTNHNRMKNKQIAVGVSLPGALARRLGFASDGVIQTDAGILSAGNPATAGLRGEATRSAVEEWVKKPKAYPLHQYWADETAPAFRFTVWMKPALVRSLDRKAHALKLPNRSRAVAHALANPEVQPLVVEGGAS